jgi:hypothetical protein
VKVRVEVVRAAVVKVRVEVVRAAVVKVRVEVVMARRSSQQAANAAAQ